MIVTHMRTLNETGLALIKKAQMMDKIGDIEKCIEIGSGLLEQAREIMEGQKLNSVLVFGEFCLYCEKDIIYEDYVEFCLRNGLEKFSRQDFELRLVKVRKALGGKG